MRLFDELLKAASELVDSVNFDMNGAKIAEKYVGGNGGLLSTETMRKSDAVRRVIDAALSEAEHKD